MSPRKATPEASGDGAVDLVGLGAAVRAQVNLLPPEVRSRRALGKVKVQLGLALLLVVLLCGLGFVWASFQERGAASDLDAAKDDVQSLMDQQAKYADVPLVKGQVAAAEAARTFGMSTEVLWSDYIAKILAILPPNAKIESISSMMPSPMEAGMVEVNPLADPGVGSLTFTTRSPTIPDAATWIEGLDSIPGFSDAVYSVAEIQDKDGTSYYETTSVVQVNETAFAGRFAEQEAK